MTTITVVNSGTGSYTIDGEGSNPTISLIRGSTYNLVINASGHPFWIQTVSGSYSSSNIYSSGVTNNGSQTDTITFVVPADAPNTLYYACQYHSSMQGMITITDSVPLTTPTITFSIPTQYYSSGATFTITPPTSNSSGAFSYASSDTDIASVSGSTVTILQIGSVTITATQEATDEYTSGTETATLTITAIVKVSPVITNFSISARNYSNGATFTITPPTSTSPGAFSYVSSNTNKATVSDSTVTILEGGTITITATQEATEYYTSGTATASLTINKISPTLTNFSIPAQDYSNGAAFTITPPSSTSTGAFSYVSSNTNIASISGSTVTILQRGSVTITATQETTDNYTSGTTTASLTIGDEIPIITKFRIPTQNYSNGTTFTITPPSSTSTGAFSYVSSNTNIASISGSTVTVLGVGTITITATQEATDDYTSGSITSNFTNYVALRSFSMRSLFTNNAQVYYKPNSLSTGGGGSGVKNHRHKQRRT